MDRLLPRTTVNTSDFIGATCLLKCMHIASTQQAADAHDDTQSDQGYTGASHIRI